MLSNELMGLLGLAIFWTTVLLCTADVAVELKDLARLGRFARAARRGRVSRGDGEGGRIAALTTELRGRALDGSPPAVEVSHDVIVVKVDGGAVDLDGEEAQIGSGEPLSVWLGEAALAEAAEQPQDEPFDALYARAAKPKGWSRPVALGIFPTDEVWIAPGGLLSTIEPTAVVARARRLFGVYLALHLTAAALVTAVALSGPMDALLTKVGAALCLAHFLASPPILRAVRARTRMPDAARRFFRWEGSVAAVSATA